MIQLSIIIPTHCRASILKRCLDHIEKQTIASQIEVIVVSDGHDPKTVELFRGVESLRSDVVGRGKSPPGRGRTGKVERIEFIEIEKSHQGVARNRGVEQAKADQVLFIGDDIFLEPDACEVHVRACTLRQAQGESFATLGFTTWDPAVGITPVMKWLEMSGWQFGYRKIKAYEHGFISERIQHRFTYTSHISLPTDVAKAHPFCEDVSLYGWEDIEWGVRLKGAGIKLYYNPDAKALHHHHMTLEDSLKRMETLGRSVVHLSAIAPTLDRRPTGLKLLLYKVAALLPTMGGRHRKAFLKGMLLECPGV